eukprot:SAG31_NODE_1967_length_6785_cov_7.007329_5_plen_53_part_00
MWSKILFAIHLIKLLSHINDDTGNMGRAVVNVRLERSTGSIHTNAVDAMGTA